MLMIGRRTFLKIRGPHLHVAGEHREHHARGAENLQLPRLGGYLRVRGHRHVMERQPVVPRSFREIRVI